MKKRAKFLSVITLFSIAISGMSALFLSSCDKPAHPSTSSGEKTSDSNELPTSEEQTDTSSQGDKTLKDYLLMNLDFADYGDLGRDASGNDNHAHVHNNGGSLALDESKHLGKNVLSFLNFDSSNRAYLDLPRTFVDSEELTFASWVYVPYPIETFHNGSPLLSIRTRDGDYFYSSPYDTDCWHGYSLNVRKKGIFSSLTKVPPSAETHWQNTPVNGTIEPLAGGWHLIGFSFASDSLKVFYNGSLKEEYPGDYSLKGKTIEEFRIGVTSVKESLSAFNGKIADVRVYKKSLSEEEYREAYQYSYKDFLSTDFEFNDSLADSARGLVASKNGNVVFTEKDGRKAVYFDGSGNNASVKSSLTLPNETLLGHNAITISTDIYIIDTGSLYQRVFEFSIGGKRFFALYVGFGQVNNLKLEYAPDSEKKRDVVLDPSYVVPTNRWINITVSADGKSGRLYVDGLLVASSSEFKYDPVIMYYSPHLHCTLGRTDFYDDVPLKGYYDNFKMYDVALSEKEVMEISGIIHEENDEKAVKKEMENFVLSEERELKLALPSYLNEGVKLSYESLSPDIMDSKGNLYPSEQDKMATMRVFFSRGEYKNHRDYEVKVPKRRSGIRNNESASLDEVEYNSGTYFDKTMLSNIDYMFTLDTERLLYNYRLNAKLDTKGSSSYGGWIATKTGGAGQFESQYVGALARYCLSKPDYVSAKAPESTNTPLKRMLYLLKEMRKCQVAYGEAYPEEKGYLSAFTHLCMEAIEKGVTTVDAGDGIHGTVPIGGVSAWVPFYMYHKNLMMCYDVYLYAKDEEVKELALTMLKDAGIWAFNEIEALTETERANVLNVEYGGMSEVMYLTYGLTNDNRFLKVARFFEEDTFLRNIYEGKNVLPHKHANTNIPKILACAAAYNVLGLEYYKSIALKAWHMIVEGMTYANGGVSLDEFFEEEGVTTQGCYGEETCCSYNLLRLSDYIYEWEGKAEYADYFENVFYNQIMASIDPLTGGKTYPISTAFGYHKIYSSPIDSFWCCCCTGQESFAKLNWGNYYKDKKSGALSVNMYNASCYQDEKTKITISGDLFIDEKVHLSVKAKEMVALRLRVPSWCQKMSLKLNGSPLSLFASDGYLTLERVWAESDDLLIELPMDYRLVKEKGYPAYQALFYGPMLLVADLGESSPSSCIHADQTAGGTFGGKYLGAITQTMRFHDSPTDYRSHIRKTLKDGKLRFTFIADNQTVEFMPFIDCLYNRFSMYMSYVYE